MKKNKNKVKVKKLAKVIKPKLKVKKITPAKPSQVVEKTVPAPVKSAAEPLQKKLKLSKDDTTKYKRLLVELRDHLIDGVNFLANENLKRSARDASGELSGYSLHMADAGTDTFDREFALSLVSNEQEALYEIEEALKRIEESTFGICEMCDKLIKRERLLAVPFARLCVQCQSGVEKERRHPLQTTAVFSETADEEDSEESEEKDKDKD